MCAKRPGGGGVHLEPTSIGRSAAHRAIALLQSGTAERSEKTVKVAAFMRRVCGVYATFMRRLCMVNAAFMRRLCGVYAVFMYGQCGVYAAFMYGPVGYGVRIASQYEVIRKPTRTLRAVCMYGPVAD